MADHAAVTIPLSRIRGIQLYINTPRKTVAQIKRATGADYIINGTLYNMRTGQVNCHMKADGQVIARPDYDAWAYLWGTGEDIRLGRVPGDEARNHIACTLLVKDGKALPKLYYDPGQGGKRGRSAIGIKGDSLALYCTRDGSGAARTPEKLRDDLAAAGWDSAIMLDGGGSAQCDFAGAQITSSRKVQHLILVYRKIEDSDEPKGDKPMVEINAYSKKQDGEKKLSTNFKVSEFACKDGSDAVLVAPRLVMVLQSIRDHFGAACTLHSGYRTPQYNAKVGGAAQSQHCYGTAADFSIKGVSVETIAAYARKIMPDWGGVGIYKSQGFVHVDVRETRADWNG